MRPVQRSPLRIAIGTVYFRVKRYLKWIFGSDKYAKNGSPQFYPAVCFRHQTPLVRKLKETDMRMQMNKIVNLRLAVARLDGIILHPGETFSYWRLIGKPTEKKGYVPGMVLFYGKVREGIGGGLCQLSNLIYWMTLHTPLTVTERHRHSYDVFPDAGRTQPFGSGATCHYNYVDLQIRNETAESFQLHVYLTEDYLVGEWRTLSPLPYAYEVYQRDHRITHEWWGGYVRHNTIYRKVCRIVEGRGDPGRTRLLLDDQFITENHAIMMYEPLLAEGEKYTVNSDEGGEIG